MDDPIVQKTLSISKDLSNFLNNNLLKKFVELHRIKPENSKFRLKQEIVAKKALFFDAKKKYALHIVNREGYNRDEFDFKGIVLRRSDYPSFTKECIEKIIDMLLKQEDLKMLDLCKYIKNIDTKIREMCLSGNKKVAKPVSYSSKTEYKVIPTHVLGMELWNNLEYKYFTPGTRGYMFKILGVDTYNAPKNVVDNINFITKKNNNIVLPFEEEKLPSYYNVDVNDMVEFAWTTRYQEILSSVCTNIDEIIIFYQNKGLL